MERLLIIQGYLKPDYNPLTFNPFLIKKLLYNPKPLGRLIGRAYLEAIETSDPNSEYIGRATMDIIERELAKPEVVAACGNDFSLQPRDEPVSEGHEPARSQPA